MKNARAYWERVLKQHGYTEHIGFNLYWNFPRPDSFYHEAWSWFQKDNIVIGVIPMIMTACRDQKSADIILVVNPTHDHYVYFKEFIRSDMAARKVKLMLHATVERDLLPLCLKLGKPYNPIIETLCKNS